jgi:hypothetical protein
VTDATLRTGLRAIAGLTIVTGAAQAAAPGKMLEPLAAENDEATRHLFRTVGMFMVVVGGGLTATLRRGPGDPNVVLWAAAQKVGASGAVGLGVKRGVFAPLALGVAGFDLLSGVLALAYWRRLRGS